MEFGWWSDFLGEDPSITGYSQEVVKRGIVQGEICMGQRGQGELFLEGDDGWVHGVREEVIRIGGIFACGKSSDQRADQELLGKGGVIDGRLREVLVD